LCWDALLVQSTGEQYSLRRATVSLAPRWLPVQACPLQASSTAATAPVMPVADDDTSSIKWRGEVQLSARELALLASRFCQASALLRFARAPFYIRWNGAWLIGDL